MGLVLTGRLADAVQDELVAANNKSPTSKQLTYNQYENISTLN